MFLLLSPFFYCISADPIPTVIRVQAEGKQEGGEYPCRGIHLHHLLYFLPVHLRKGRM